MKQLSPKEYEFAQNYIKNGFNAYQAALTAGYKPEYAKKYSYKIIQRPAIQGVITKAVQRIDQKLGVTIEWRVNKLKAIINAVIGDDGTHDKQYYKDALKAIAEINKMSGDYAPDKRLSITVDETQGKLIEARKAYEEY